MFENLLLNNNNLYENTKFGEFLKNENKNAIEEWLINYEEINKMCESKEFNPLKLYYFKRKYIDKILYDKNELIKLNVNQNCEKLSYYFYLSLLIRNNPHIVNYSYSFEFIKNIYDNNNKNENNKYKKIMMNMKKKKIIKKNQ